MFSLPTDILHQHPNKNCVPAVPVEVPHPWDRFVVSEWKGMKRMFSFIPISKILILPVLDRYGGVSCFPIPSFTLFLFSIPRIGTTSPLALARDFVSLRHPPPSPSPPGSSADPPGLPSLPPQPYFFPLCLRDQSSRVSTHTHPTPPGGWGAGSWGWCSAARRQSCHQQPL